MNFKDIIGPDELDWKVIPLDWKKIGKDELKLGTPMSKDGLEANDASCYGILMDDVEKSKHFQARVIVSGCVDFAKAEEYSGIKISEEAKNAIGKVWSQAGGVPSWNDLPDKPFDENGAIKPEALPEGYPYKEGEKHTVTVSANDDFSEIYIDNGKSVETIPVEDDIFVNEDYVLIGDAIPKKDLKSIVVANPDGVTAVSEMYDVFVNGGLISDTIAMLPNVRLFVVYEDGATDKEGVVWPAVGTYLDIVHELPVSVSYGETIHTMAPEFTPKPLVLYVMEV